MRVIGIDPGLRNTGFGVVEVKDTKLTYLSSGVISTSQHDSLPERLKVILDSISSIINDTKPQVASIEKVFVNVNPQSTLLLGQARGTTISACVLNNLSVVEYTALQIKQSVVGYGHADKLQIAKMTRYLLNLNGIPKQDAADALAAALTHIHYTKICSFFNMSSVRGGRLIQ